MAGRDAGRLTREEGQGLAEYALILALIAIVAILSLVFLGDTINDLMSLIGRRSSTEHVALEPGPTTPNQDQPHIAPLGVVPCTT